MEIKKAGDHSPAFSNMKGDKMMQAIETEYRGYKFRSRLEARWAVFFDEIGARWEYEPEGFVLEDGTKYLPDFLLHGVRGRGAAKNGDIYIEVKGALTQEDLHKVELFSMPIIIFGQIPDATLRKGQYYNGEPYEYWDFDFGRNQRPERTEVLCWIIQMIRTNTLTTI